MRFTRFYHIAPRLMQARLCVFRRRENFLWAMQEVPCFRRFLHIALRNTCAKRCVRASRRTNLSGAVRPKHFRQKWAARAFWIEIMLRHPPRDWDGGGSPYKNQGFSIPNKEISVWERGLFGIEVNHPQSTHRAAVSRANGRFADACLPRRGVSRPPRRPDPAPAAKAASAARSVVVRHSDFSRVTFPIRTSSCTPTRRGWWIPIDKGPLSH
jgi:hypothetical protein